MSTELGDGSALLGNVAAGVIVSDESGYFLPKTPAVVRWQAFNPANPANCTGFMSRPVEVRGLWLKAGVWNSNRVLARVVQFSKASEAHEAFVAWSLERGVSGSDCTGFATPFGVADYAHFDVKHRGLDLPGMPAGVPYNSWSDVTAPNSEGTINSFGAIVQKGDTVVLAIVSYAAGATPDLRAVGALTAGITNRI